MTVLLRYYKNTNKLIWARTFLVCAAVFFASFAQAQFWSQKNQPLLPEEEAFAVTASVDQTGQLLVAWSIADDYYMYREQFAIESSSPGVEIGQIGFPQGVVEDDPEFGAVEVYFYNATLKTDVQGSGAIDLVIKGQGCNKPVGVCYPPISRVLTVNLPEGLVGSSSQQKNSSTLAQNEPPKPTQTQAKVPLSKSFLGYMLAAFGTGLLLSFTPCVLPMIPILAGVIAGQKNPSRWQSGWLAICYVAGTIVTYIIAGVVAGATGAQLQAAFQNVWVIGAICALLVALAFSLFGFYRVELPSALQTRLNNAGNSTKSASFSSFVLGLISALVVGACVSPLLIVALGTAISQGDPILGAAIMGSMALGMGLLLILFGFGAGWLLPRAGAWMQHVQVVFGLMLIGVAIYLLGAFPFVPVLMLWAALFLVSGFYLWSLASEPAGQLTASVLRMLAAGLLIWGVLAGVGASLSGDDVLNPLAGISLNGSNQTTKSTLPLITTTTLDQVQSEFATAQVQGRPVMLDFYADWCLDCKRMHRTTFKQESVQQALSGWHLIEVDVTENSEASKKVKQAFSVFGPPATLFFLPNGKEVEQLRQYGYINEDDFLALVAQVAIQQSRTNKP